VLLLAYAATVIPMRGPPGWEGYISYGVYLALLAVFRCQARDDPRWSVAVGLFWLEELTIIGILVWVQEYSESWNKVAFAASVAAAGWMLLRAPLPDGLLPLRGIWLRRLLAMLTTAGVAQQGWIVWLYALGRFPVSVRVVSACFVAWAAWPSVRLLSRGWRWDAES
jgi:hypothetical protein